VRRLISAIMLALAVGLLSLTASAVASAQVLAAPGQQKFGVRLVDVPVSEAGNPRALRYIVDYLPVGTVIHRRILIMNQETRTARFTVYPDAAYIANGTFIGYAGQTRSELTNWISVQHPVVTLAPGASATDMITVKVPAGATRDEHYGVIWVQQAAESKVKAGFGVTEISRVGIRIYLAVGRGGTPPTSFAIASITARRLGSGRSAIFVRIDNTGGRAVDLSGSASLADGPGNSSSGPFATKQALTLAPGQDGSLSFVLPKSLPNGSWRATVRLASGLTTCVATATITIGPMVAAQGILSGIGRIWLGLGFLCLVLVVVMLRYARQHRRLPA
jgi:hypothetical protein